MMMERNKMSGDFPWDRSDSILDDFVTEHLRPDDEIANTLDLALDDLTTSYLRTGVSYDVSRIRRGGRLAQRTNLKDDLLDFELYVFIADLHGIDEHRQRIDQILIETRDVLDDPDKMHRVMVRDEDEKGMSRDGRVSIKVLVDDEWFDGKVYPVMDLLGVRPTNATLDIMYRRYITDTDKLCYTPALKILYVNLLQSLPQNVIDLILLLKYWIKTKLQLKGRKPPARLWEVICIHHWEVTGSPNNFNCARALLNILELLSDRRAIMITWETSKIRRYSKKIADDKKREVENRNRSGEQVAVIFDPIDPELNHTHGITLMVWDEIARTAMDSCSDQIFHGFKRNQNNGGQVMTSCVHDRP